MYRWKVSTQHWPLEISEPEKLPVEKFKKDCKKDKYENVDSDDHNEPHKRMEDALGNPWPTTTAFSREFFFPKFKFKKL